MIHVEFTADGTRVIASSNTGQVLVMTPDLRVVRNLRHDTGVFAIAAPREGYIAASNRDGALTFWNLDMASEFREQWSRPLYSVRFPADGSRYLVGSAEGAAWVSRESREVQWVTRSAPQRVVGCSPDGRFVASLEKETVRLWERGPVGWIPREVPSPAGVPRRGLDVAVENDGSLYLAGDGKVTRWTEDSRREFKSPGTHWRLAISPGGSVLATASATGEVAVFSVDRDGAPIHLSHEKGVRDVVFVDEGRLLTGSVDGTARLWDLESREETVLYEGHRSAVYTLDVSPDRRLVVTGSNDRTARLWTIEGELLASLPHPQRVQHALFSPDGEWILTACPDGGIYFWHARLHDLIQRVDGMGIELDVTARERYRDLLPR